VIPTVQHERFNRKVWTFKADFTSSLAKWLVSQSPYVVPDNLSACVEKFHTKLDELGDFDANGMAEIGLSMLSSKIAKILESIPEIMELNKPRNGHNQNIFVSSHMSNPVPDDDFICVGAVAQNIVCDFADRADAQCYLDERRGVKS